jgi:DNA-directed RNA polymerase specialized sigma24 family protein
MPLPPVPRRSAETCDPASGAALPAIEGELAVLWYDVRRYIGVLVDAGSAEDLAQETFLRAHQALS